MAGDIYKAEGHAVLVGKVAGVAGIFHQVAEPPETSAVKEPSGSQAQAEDGY